MSIVTVREAFRRASGLATRNAAMSYVGNAQVLEFDGIDAHGHRFHVESAPTLEDPHQAATRLGHTAKIRFMNKPSSLAQRIAETKKRHDAEADAIAKRLDELDSKAPAAFAHAQSIVNSQHDDIDAMEAELKQLTNL